MWPGLGASQPPEVRLAGLMWPGLLAGQLCAERPAGLMCVACEACRRVGV